LDILYARPGHADYRHGSTCIDVSMIGNHADDLYVAPHYDYVTALAGYRLTAQPTNS